MTNGTLANVTQAEYVLEPWDLLRFGFLENERPDEKRGPTLPGNRPAEWNLGEASKASCPTESREIFNYYYF